MVIIQKDQMCHIGSKLANLWNGSLKKIAVIIINLQLWVIFEEVLQEGLIECQDLFLTTFNIASHSTAGCNYYKLYNSSQKL
jgi:hypothetical protein